MHPSDEQPLIGTLGKGQRMILKLGLYVCGLVLAAYCGYAAYRYSLSVGADIVFAYTMVGLTAGNLLLAAAASRLWNEGYRLVAKGCAAIWAVVLVVLLANSAGFTVGNRRSVAVGKDTEIASHTRAQQAYDETVSALTQAHKDTLWNETSACADATRKVQRNFCTRVNQLETEKGRLNAELQHAPPASSDVQAEGLSQMLGGSSSAAGTGMSVTTAVVVEVTSNAMLLVAGILPWPAWLKWPVRVPPMRVEPTPAKPKRSRRSKRKRRLEPPRQRQEVQEAPAPPVPRPPLRLVIGDKL
jgi:hypothetical protein